MLKKIKISIFGTIYFTNKYVTLGHTSKVTITINTAYQKKKK
jgi:hypothetical protein